MISRIVSQLPKPRGLLGKVLSKFLRKMNSAIYDQVIKDVNVKAEEDIFQIGIGHGAGIQRIVSKIENSRFTDLNNFNLYDIHLVLEKLTTIGFISSYRDFENGHVIKAIRA